MNSLVYRVKGGLGNQLFIYAFSLAFNKFKNHNIYYDNISGFIRNDFSHIQTNKFLLDKYFPNIKKPKIHVLFLLHIIRKFKIKGSIFDYIHDEFNLLDEANAKILSNKTYLIEGYFQNFKLISDSIPEIRKTIKYKPLSNQVDLDNLSLINKSNSIAIQIRVNDYNVPIPKDYIYKSINILKGKFDNPHWFLFTDNLEWCKLNLNLPSNIIYINSGDDEIDFKLMTSCKHFILTLGTFGWWGAMLSLNNEKEVFYPIKFKEYLNKNLFPLNWECIN